MALINDLVFGNISANDYDIYISGEGVYNAPSRDVELVDIPGRNGALTIDHNRYENITIEYPAFTFATSQTDFRRIVNAYKNAIMSQLGYQKLIDTYNPNEYRMALYVEGLEFEPVHYGRAATFTLKFNCKPQRYLVDGESEVTVTDGDTLVNPTLYDASPLLMVEGYGTINFNGYDIEIENALMGEIVIGNGLSYIDNESITFSENMTIDSTNINNGDDIYFGLTVSKSFAEAVPQSYRYTDAYTVTQNGDLTNNNVTIGSTITALNPSAVNVNSWNTGASFMVRYTKVPLIYGQSGTFSIDLTIGVYNTDVPGDSQTMPSEYVTFDVAVSGTYDGANTISIQFSGSDGTNFANPSSRVAMTQVVYETSTVIGDSTISMLGNPTYIDCELGECYKYEDGNVVDLNSYIDLGSDLPTLASGENTVTCDDTITSLVIVPRWWQL